ncbi:MAG: nucleotidyltransferase [Methanosarcinales archaeon]|nr:nucleotidyltransferase [Methanosarcinales archaeon]
MRFRTWESVKKELDVICKQLKDDPRIITVGGTALLYHGLKKSTRDLDFVFPTQGECYWFAKALTAQGFEVRKSANVWRFIDFERNLYIDISYGTVGDVALTQSMFARLIEEQINGFSIWIVSLTDLFIMKACHSVTTYETDAIGDALRIVERVDMGEVEDELEYQSETVRRKVGMFMEEFGGYEKKYCKKI